MIQKFDLHMHTNRSDGEYSAKKVVELLRENGITTFSITDHDCMDSIHDLSKIDLTGLKYVKGIELTTKYDGKYNMHILGYNIDENNQQLIDACNWVKGQRRKRIFDLQKKIFDLHGIMLPDEDIEKIALSENNPGRPHLAKLLVKYGYVESTEEAFKKYLGHLSTKIPYKMDAEEAFGLIHQAGGLAFWAHPKKVEKEYQIDMVDLLDEMKSKGLDGVEIGNCLHSLSDLRRYQKAANEKGLLTSAGSDYHGPHVKEKVLLGDVYNSDENEKIALDELTLLKNETEH